jgi:hypothetical protein
MQRMRLFNCFNLENRGINTVICWSKFDVNITKYYSLFTSESSSSYCVNNLNFPANAHQIDKAKDLIKKLAFSFNSEGFENPVLQKYWRNIEALAY